MRRIPLLIALLVPATASAHFHLDAPDAEWAQTTQGDPQKDFPCGPGAISGAGTATNATTTVMTGSTLTVTITETITHPGHYRVAIAQDEAGLPAEPIVTAGTTACGSVPIEANPTLPLLADGLFQHTTAFTSAQTAQVQLPAGMTCNNCVVQVLEFMSNHTAPCFYHHCARVNVIDGPAPDAGVTNPGTGDDAGTGPHDPGGTSGGCSAGGNGAPGVALIGLVLGVVVLRRRRGRSL